jgi:hypothetical protein
LYVRGIRSPAWNLQLARRVSEILGGVGLVHVVDRLRDHYGQGLFHAGRTVEASAIADPSAPLVRLGLEPSASDRMVVASLDEDRVQATFVSRLEALFDLRARPEARERVESRILAGDVDALERTRFDADDERPITQIVLADVTDAQLRASGAPIDGWRWRAMPGATADPIIDDPATYDWESWAERTLPGHVLLERDGPLDEALAMDLAGRLGARTFTMALAGGGSGFTTWDSTTGSRAGRGADAFVEAWKRPAGWLEQHAGFVQRTDAP